QYPVEEGVLELLPPALCYQQDRRRFFEHWKDALRDLSLPAAPGESREPVTAPAQQAIDQQEHFDWYADNDQQSYSNYAASPFWRAVDELVFAAWRQEVSRAVSMKPCAILDVGCAQGPSSFHLAPLGARLVGFDGSKRCIRVARARSREEGTDRQMTFICADAEAFPFRSNLFDYVLVYCVLHHVPNPAHACIEIGRVLKPGGMFLGSENNRTAFRAV